jgi:hypothetical protein
MLQQLASQQTSKRLSQNSGGASTVQMRMPYLDCNLYTRLAKSKCKEECVRGRNSICSLTAGLHDVLTQYNNYNNNYEARLYKVRSERSTNLATQKQKEKHTHCFT